MRECARRLPPIPIEICYRSHVAKLTGHVTAITASPVGKD
jgi:hypothetical protein